MKTQVALYDGKCQSANQGRTFVNEMRTVASLSWAGGIVLWFFCLFVWGWWFDGIISCL